LPLRPPTGAHATPNKRPGQSGEARPGKRKAFFFEKKKQKTFDFFDLAADLSQMQGETVPKTKVFWFFFSKKNIFLSL